MKLVIIVCAALVVVALPATAVPGALDSSFGGDGVVTSIIAPGPAEANAVAIQADGKIVTAGVDNLLEGSRQTSRFALARYNTDGSLDPTFGGDGVVRTNFTPQKDHAFGVAIQADGRIVATGEAGDGPGANTMFAAARYNTDGTLDPTFGTDGKVTTDFTPMGDFGQAVAIQADGKIVEDGLSFGVNGNATFALVRYNTDGTLDTTFGGDGRVTADFTPLSDFSFHVAFQSDGKIVAAGVSGFGAGFADVNSTFALARFNADLSLPTQTGEVQMGAIRSGTCRSPAREPPVPAEDT
jgi:uncharacterized delta-60 repeat protein